MARRDPRFLILPALGFVVLLGVAGVVAARTGARPEADLYRAARAWVGDLSAGELDRALALYAGPLTPLDLERLRQRVGGLGQITQVRTLEDGRAGEVRIEWFGARGRGQGRVRMLWTREARGWRIQRVLPG